MRIVRPRSGEDDEDRRACLHDGGTLGKPIKPIRQVEISEKVQKFLVAVGVHQIRELPRDQLAEFVNANLAHLLEDEVLAVLANRYVTPAILQAIAHNLRLTGFYSVR